MNRLRLQRMYGYGGQETAARPGQREIVSQWEQALLFRNGALVRTLGPGANRHWALGYSLRRVDIRPRILEVPTQEIPTSDGVTVKVSVAGRVRIVDPVALLQLRLLQQLSTGPGHTVVIGVPPLGTTGSATPATEGTATR